MSPNSQDIASIIKRQIEEFGGDFTMVDIGTVIETGDGVVTVSYTHLTLPTNREV